MDKAGGSNVRTRPYLLFVACSLLAAILVFVANPGPLQSLRNIAFDSFQRLWPARAADFPVRIVAIDEESLQHLGQWPWPRTVLAQLTDKLGEAGAASIVFDVVFAEPDRTSPEQMLTWMAPERSSALRGVVGRWPTHDHAFAEALARHPTVLAAVLDVGTGASEFPLKAGMVVSGDNPAPELARFTTHAGNVAELSDAARGLGFINWTPDRDQVVRRTPLLAAEGEGLVPSLALEALRVAEGQSTYVVRAAQGGRPTVQDVRLGPHVFATDRSGALWMHFRRGDPSRYIPAWRVIDGSIDPAQVRGTIVLVGATAPGLLDLRATPIDASIPGVEIHQQVLEQMISGGWLTRPDIAPALELLIGLVSIVLLAWVMPRLPAAVGGLVGAGVVLAIVGGSAFAFVNMHALVDPVFPALCAFLFAVVTAIYLFRGAEHQRAEIRRAFSQYVSPTVVRQLAAHPERLKLGGEVRDLTLLFCDVRNFTSISERLNAEQLTSFINSLLTPLSDIIIEHGGTIDKYMGDAIMAFWNAPMDDSDHAAHACAAAAQMAAKMDELNAVWRAEAEAEGRPFAEVAIGIGVNTGECCVGNLGSHRRFDYSAIGDNVNITSRLEGLTKLYGLSLVAGEETMRRLDAAQFVEIDLVRVKGRSTPTRLFTLATLVESAAGDVEAMKRAHAALLAAYREGRWQEARTVLEAARVAGGAPLSGLYALYQSRLSAEAPPPGWDGVYDMERK